MTRFIEAHLEIHGELSTTHICSQFSVKRNKASRLISAYRKLERNTNLKLCPDRKCWVKTVTFKRLVLPKDIRAFELLTAISLSFDE